MLKLLSSKAVIAGVCLVSSASAYAYSSLFIFGDSLSDSGNNAIAFDALGESLDPPLAPGTLRTPVPISGNSFVPTYPYSGSNVYTNDKVWAQNFASFLGLSAAPALAFLNSPPPPGGLDYAFGGANTGPLTPNSLPGGLLDPFPASLETQAAFFLAQHGNVAPSDALYVVAGGGNNARDALTDISTQILTTCPPPSDPAYLGCANAIIQSTIKSTASDFATDIGTIVNELEGAGASHIVVWDVPDIGKAPAVTAMGASTLGTALASAMNGALLNAIRGDPDVKLFDIFGLVDQIVANNGAFGISLDNVTDACAQFPDCVPSDYFFWDGIHPTSAGQQILSLAMLQAIPEPASLCLLSLAFCAMALARRRHLR
jgi:outer membrane lipase/esterase